MSELRPISYRFKAEHAATLRKVAMSLSRSPIRGIKAESFLVGLLLMDLAEKIDDAYENKAAKVVPFPSRGPEPPTAA